MEIFAALALSVITAVLMNVTLPPRARRWIASGGMSELTKTVPGTPSGWRASRIARAIGSGGVSLVVQDGSEAEPDRSRANPERRSATTLPVDSDPRSSEGLEG